MRKLVFASAATIALAISGMLLNSTANAAVGSGLSTTSQEFNLIQKTDWIFGGHKHCWYDEGWHGPGWYWCGYAHRKGHGWGGPEGFQGWKH
jgi:hypothetical protein